VEAFYHSFNSATTPLGRILETGLDPESNGPLEGVRVLKSYALVYTLAGKGRHRQDEGPATTLKPGDLMILFPGISHSYGPARNEKWAEFFIVFDGPVFDLWRKKGILDPRRPIVHLEPVPHWLSKLSSILPRERSKSSLAPMEEICSLQKILAELIAKPVEGKVSEWQAEACSLLEADLEKELDLSAVARAVGISYESFRKQFAQKYGQSPGRYRTSCRVNRACRLMSDSSLPSKEIAEMVGFANEFHFSRRFKQLTGKTPTEYRRSLSLAAKLASRK
jgi:AraC-like DNA-binding protein